METLILTPADFAAKGFDLPAGIEPRLNPHILAAQETRLRPLLGVALYDELLRRYATSAEDPATDWVAPWPALRAACASLVVAVAWGRYLPLGQLTVATHSIVVKDARDSKPADAQQIREAVRIMNDDAVRYEAELRRYLSTAPAPADFATWLPAPGCGSRAASNHSSTRTRPLRSRGYPPSGRFW